MEQNELMHFGVKGMKWGVRRFQKKDGTLTPAGKERYSESSNTSELDEKEPSRKKMTTEQKIAIGAAAAATALVVLGGMYVYKKQNIPIHVKHFKFGEKVDLDSLSSEDTILSKGIKMHRISSKSVEDYAGEGKRLYVSYLNKDNRLYKEEMPKFIRQWGAQGIISDDGKTSYDHVLKTKNKIKVASKRAMAEMYMEATQATEVDKGHYQRFMTNLVDDKNPEVRKFFEIAKRRGYNAILDENDAGNFAKSPLILLNPYEDIESSRAHRISAIEKILNVILM